jgi:hypothetical protein
MPNDKTLTDHLAAARAARNPENLRAHAQRIARLPRQRLVKPCDCERTDGTHAGTCPVYQREWRRKRRNASPSSSE